MSAKIFSSEEELLKGIFASEKALRTLAIEEAASYSPSRVLLDALKTRQAVEDDVEISFLLEVAVFRITELLNPRQKPRNETRIGSFVESFKAGSSKERINLLESLPSSSVQPLLPEWVALLDNEKNPIVASEMIKKFGEHFSETEIPILSKLLFSPFVTVRSAALEWLIAKKPKLLLKEMPKLLVSEDPKIRALAVRGLAKFDPKEAGLHLESMLLEGAPINRVMALQNCLLLPFELVKLPLLKYCAGENDVSFLARAGLVFNINPDPEVPYRLFEIIESSSGAKVEAVRKILDGACKVIKASRILKNNYSEYLKRLQEWVDRRVARRKVFGYLKKLVEPEIDQTPLEKLVLADIQKKEVRDAFKEALEWQIPEILKNRIKDFLSGEKHQKHSSNKNSLEDFDRISVEEKIRLFVCLGSDEKEKLAPILDRILTDKKAPDNLRAMGLRTALRLEMGNFSDLAFNWVMGSREILIASAIEYLSYFNIDLVIPLLGIHLKSSNPRLRILAINVLKKANPSHAISALIAILRSRDSESRKLAMDCLIQFDFSLLREPLVEFLLSSRGKKFIPEILPLFQANPDPENFFSLYRIEMCLNPAAAKSVKAARLLCEEILVKCGRLTKDKTGQREKDLIERYSFEEEKRRNPQAYAISKLRKLSESRVTKWENILKNIADSTSYLPSNIAKIESSQ